MNHQTDIVAQSGGVDEGTAFRIGDATRDWHRHDRGQLTMIWSGHLHVRTRWGSWLLPSGRALWIPAGVDHWGRLEGVRGGCNPLIARRLAAILPDAPRVIEVGALLRSIVERLCTLRDGSSTPERRRLTAVLIDEIGSAPIEPLHLPMPLNEQLLRIMHKLLADPAGHETIDVHAARVGCSARTVRRRLVGETGLTFTQWREKARLVRAIEMLTTGPSVAETADELGYATPSGFITMFRRVTGRTPGRYLQSRHGV